MSSQVIFPLLKLLSNTISSASSLVCLPDSVPFATWSFASVSFYPSGACRPCKAAKPLTASAVKHLSSMCIVSLQGVDQRRMTSSKRAIPKQDVQQHLFSPCQTSAIESCSCNNYKDAHAMVYSKICLQCQCSTVDCRTEMQTCDLIYCLCLLIFSDMGVKSHEDQQTATELPNRDKRKGLWRILHEFFNGKHLNCSSPMRQFEVFSQQTFNHNLFFPSNFTASLRWDFIFSFFLMCPSGPLPSANQKKKFSVCDDSMQNECPSLCFQVKHYFLPRKGPVVDKWTDDKPEHAELCQHAVVLKQTVCLKLILRFLSNQNKFRKEGPCSRAFIFLNNSYLRHPRGAERATKTAGC